MSARDRAADERDREADRRDVAAQTRDEVEAETQKQSADRAMAATDRDDGARDRAAAADDRESARQDLASADVDVLTGAMGRRTGLAAIQREIDRAKRSGEELSIAFVDTVGLKAINDSQGHAAGDRVLEEIATAIKEDFRPYDLLVRIGGDEFLSAHSGQVAAQLDDRYEALSRLLDAGTSGAKMTVGFAALRPGDSIGELVARADRAMMADRRPRSA
jgi:diguanylate cyclase (GGDEF)-like protein